ncbi:NAD(P)-binding protein [Exidia glandulosa HHB12029]|uniref:NAD(P)-binding protein n=1 Tax=Exidia glandulosa HHB12029 TaxID=1314781 RepID=A0A165G7G5_EXIGL|nr:NAD(P)-binding protein [Exidia glandulosa HHB12029]
MVTWFITGTSRGIGFELAKQLAANAQNTVFASCRSPATAKALNELASSVPNKNVHVIALDVDDEPSVRSAVKSVEGILPAGAGIDYLINNAAFYEHHINFETATPDSLEAHFKTHVSGSFRVFRAFLPLVQKSERKVVVTVSSEVGSMTHVDSEWNLGTLNPPYAIAKAGSNMLSKKIAVTYPDLISFAFSPGWIKTDLGGEAAPFDVGDCVPRHIKVYEGATKEHSGKFIDQFGKEIPW